MEKISNSKCMHYCFTWFEYPEDCKTLVESYYNDKLHTCVFIVCGYEVAPTTGKKHLQCYVQYKNQRKFDSVKNELHAFFNNKFHIERCKGSDRDNLIYCSKEKEVFYFGECKKIDGISNQGKRSDIDDVKSFIDKGASIDDVSAKYFKVYLKYEKSLRSYIEMRDKRLQREQNTKYYDKTVLNEYQVYFKDRLLTQNDRKITWVCDDRGNLGKTYFSKYMESLKDIKVCIILNGKTRDIMEVYNNEDYVIINFVRSEEDVINYTVLENFKDGLIFKQKYGSRVINRTPIKLIVFSNFAPKIEKLSSDRWDIININKENGDIEEMCIPQEVLNIPKGIKIVKKNLCILEI